MKCVVDGNQQIPSKKRKNDREEANPDSSSSSSVLSSLSSSLSDAPLRVQYASVFRFLDVLLPELLLADCFAFFPPRVFCGEGEDEAEEEDEEEEDEEATKGKGTEVEEMREIRSLTS